MGVWADVLRAACGQACPLPTDTAAISACIMGSRRGGARIETRREHAAEGRKGTVSTRACRRRHPLGVHVDAMTVSHVIHRQGWRHRDRGTPSKGKIHAVNRHLTDNL